MTIYSENRKTGIPLVGDIPWGTHFCQFYHAKKELLEILVPYLKTGFENNEFCVWITSDSSGNKEAKEIINRTIPDFKKYATNGQLDIIPYRRWRADNKKPGNAIVTRLNRAILSGFNGLRLVGIDLPENAISRVSEYTAVALSAYSHCDFDTAGMMETVKKHQFALVRNAGRWEVIESSGAQIVKDALKRSEEKFQSLFNNMSEGFAYHRIVLDAGKKPCDYIFLETNEAFEKLTGLRRKDVIGRRVTEVLPGIQKDPVDWIGKYGKVALTGKSVQFENYSEPLRKWYSVSAFSPHKGYFAANFIDITDRKNKEAELQKLNRLLKAHSASDQAMMRATDETEHLKEVCRIIVEDCGHSMVWVGFAENDREKTIRPVAQAGFEEGYIKTLNLTWADTERGRGPSGTAIRTGKPCGCANIATDPAFKPWRAEALKRGYASSLVLPLKDGERTFGALMIYSRKPDSFSESEVKLLAELADDLAYGILTLRSRLARQKAEEELRKTRDYLEKLISYANAPIICWDTDFNITKFNHAFEYLTKYKAGEIIGKKLTTLFPEERKDKSSIKTLPGEGKTFCREYMEAVEIPVRLKDGRTRTVLWNSANIYEADGKTLVGTIAQGQDITERKLAEEVLKRDKETFEKQVRARTRELLNIQSELEKTKRLSDIGTLAATVAHELRNPLAAISMAASNIRRKAANPLLDKHLNNVDKKITESNQIINNLLFYSRIRMPQLEKVDITDILKECVETAKSIASRKVPTRMELDISKSNPLEADPLQMKEVFFNILDNACDAVSSDPRGKIRIRSAENTGFINIRIEDTGTGIDRENLGKIFEPFFTTKAKGTGLGLYVCQQIVKLHGGDITIESEPGKGTVVSVNLPRGTKNGEEKSTDH